MSKYVVYDLEMCKVPKGVKREEFGCRQELIQIGAVLLDEEYNTIDSFIPTLFGKVVVIMNIHGCTMSIET